MRLEEFRKRRKSDERKKGRKKESVKNGKEVKRRV